MKEIQRQRQRYKDRQSKIQSQGACGIQRKETIKEREREKEREKGGQRDICREERQGETENKKERKRITLGNQDRQTETETE